MPKERPTVMGALVLGGPCWQFFARNYHRRVREFPDGRERLWRSQSSDFKCSRCAPMRVARYVTGLMLLGTVAGPVHASEFLLMSGKELYGRFCTSCHGDEGRGDGPVARFLNVEVPDLTLIARRQGGKYPYERIEKIIDGRFIIGAHGTRTMPVWGEELGRAQLGDPKAEEVTRTAVERLSDYLWTIQKVGPDAPIKAVPNEEPRR